MDYNEALQAAQALVGPLADTIDSPLWLVAAERSLTLDTAGLLPGQDGYTASYDAHWLAAEAVSILATQSLASGGIEQATSEGATFRFTAPDLHRMAAELRAQSGLSKVARRDFGILQIDGTLSDYAPRSGRVTDGLSALSNGAVVPKSLDWT